VQFIGVGFFEVELWLEERYLKCVEQNDIGGLSVIQLSRDKVFEVLIVYGGNRRRGGSRLIDWITSHVVQLDDLLRRSADDYGLPLKANPQVARTRVACSDAKGLNGDAVN